MKKRGWPWIALFVVSLGLTAAADSAEPAQLKVIGTASQDCIVLTLTSPGPLPESFFEPSRWGIADRELLSLGRISAMASVGGPAENWAVPMTHRVYLELAEKLSPGSRYEFRTPLGPIPWVFKEREVLCESIKINQAGYDLRARTREAAFSVFLGSAGARIDSEAPDFEVFDLASGELALAGKALPRAFTGTGYVADEGGYALPLAGLRAGGPFRILVKGAGVSPEFKVTEDNYRSIAKAEAKGLFAQRCGIALDARYTGFPRLACHPWVEVTDAVSPGFIAERGPVRPIKGGYHDAGDFDKYPAHILVPAWLLELYECAPGARTAFGDGSLGIPESGDKVPDWLNEALWGCLLWEELQEEDGGVRAGVEADRHPSYGSDTASTDPLTYRTFRVEPSTTMLCAGLFAQASRLVKPFDAKRAAGLLERARRAHRRAGELALTVPALSLYAAGQLYLATGEGPFLAALKVAAGEVLETGGDFPPRSFEADEVGGGRLFGPFFASLLLSKDPALKVIAAPFRKMAEDSAKRTLDSLEGKLYPVGPAEGWSWGSCTMQGLYAEALIIMHSLTKEKAYYDGICRLGDYSLGLNPAGRSYVTGLGAFPPANPLHLDSYPSMSAGKGPVPGITVFGPVAIIPADGFQDLYAARTFPAWESLPVQRRYSDGWPLVACNEFTIWRSMGQNLCLYAYLASTLP